MFFYFAIFIVIGILTFLSLKRSSTRLVFSILIALALIVIAGLRQVGVDQDSGTYQVFFNWVNSPADYFTSFSQYYFFEPGYYLLPAILKSVFNADVVWFFLIVAIIGVSLKIIAIWRLTEFQLFSILVYFCHFFLIHDMTQIREGIASGILLLSLVEIEKRKFLKFLLLLSVGIFFHYSALIFLPFYFLNSYKLNKKMFYSILIVPQILYLLRINIITILMLFKLGIISEKLSYYNDLLESGIFTSINVYNSVYIVQLLFCFFLIWKSDYLQTKNKYASLLIKIYAIGIGSWALFSSIPVIAFRISAFLEIVEIILVPFILYCIEERFIAIVFIVLFGFGLLYIDIIHTSLLQPYSIVKK